MLGKFSNKRSLQSNSNRFKCNLDKPEPKYETIFLKLKYFLNNFKYILK